METGRLQGEKFMGMALQMCVVVAGKAVVAITRDEESAGSINSFSRVYIPPVCQRHLSLLAVNSQIHKSTNPQSTSHSTTIHNERSSPAADPAQVLFSLAQCSTHTLAEGKGLKKTQVNDRSAPQVAGKAGGAGASSSSSTAASAGGASSNATSRPPAPPMPSGNDPASQLAGLFAGGMPTLRKTGDRAACQYESLLAMIIILLQWLLTA